MDSFICIKDFPCKTIKCILCSHGIQQKLHKIYFIYVSDSSSFRYSLILGFGVNKLAKMFTMRFPAFPSPNGDISGNMACFLNVRFIEARIDFLATPTTFANPASTASGLSVNSLATRTGLRIGGAVASSCIPPESVIIVLHFFISIRKSK